ncbi:MAG: TonB-dependent receptor [Bacteroidales bacterium]|nr:TonB-dependent receptor [Bacteroidales bacterium]
MCALASLLLVCITSLGVRAQSLSVSGTVLDQAGQPVFGAAIMVKGTNTGVTSDMDGTYTIKVANKNATLQCQLYGYEPQEVAINGRSKVDFTLKEDSEMLDATVVVGYGTLKKAQLVGAVETLDSEALEGRVNASVTRTLQGQIPGLNIIQTDGKPNHSGQVYIRGNSTSYNRRASMTSATGASESIGQGGSALVLIDGVEGDLSTVNPEDIESVSVLKDASSAAVYGARGSYGVILVTTKQPSKDKVSVTYSGSVSVKQRLINWEDNYVDNSYIWAVNFDEFYKGDSVTPTAPGKQATKINNRGAAFDDAYLAELKNRMENGYKDIYGVASNGSYIYYGNVNWYDIFYKKANVAHTHNVTVQGSSDRVSWWVSGRYYGQDGIYKIGKEKYDQFNLRAKGKIKITKWLTFDNNTSVFKRDYFQPTGAVPSEASGNILRNIEHRGQPLYPIYNQDGTYTFYAAAVGYQSFVRNSSYQNNDKLDVITTSALTFDIIKEVLQIKADYTYKGIRSKQERISDTVGGYDSPGALTLYNTSAYKSEWQYDTDYNATNVVLTWTPKINANHNLNIVAGWNAEKTVYRRRYETAKGTFLNTDYPSWDLFYVGENIPRVEEGASYNKAMMGAFARINYTLFNRYIIEVAGRYDGSSLFPKKSQWGFFPSASAGWRISEERWMQGAKNWLSNFKIRANFGSLGNAQISPYKFISTTSLDSSSALIDGSKFQYLAIPTEVSDNLTWEKVTTWDVGVDLDFFHNRLSLSADYYNRNTTDLYCQGPELPGVLGQSTPKGNFGALRTKGFEVTLGWKDQVNVGGKPFSYGIKASLWDSRTWVTSYYNESGNILTYYEGKELGEIWGFRTDGIFKSNEEANNWATDTFHKNGSNFRAYAGDLKFLDIDGDGDINYGKGTLASHGDLERIGNETPRYQYGINLEARWNGIGIAIFLQGVGHRDWYPDCDSGFFWGMYNRPYSQIWDWQLGDNRAQVDMSTENWVVTNADKNPYWTRPVGYSANRNVGPLTMANDHYLQNAAYLRLKNLTIDYNFPKKLLDRAKIAAVKLYISGDNLATWTPLSKYAKNFDPETISNGDSDFDTTSGLSGLGQGYSYPMQRTFTFGVNLTF